MANQIRPEDIRRIAAQKEREVFGEDGTRHFVDPRMDFSPQAPLAPSAALPPLVAEPRSRGPYDRAALRNSPDDRGALRSSPPPLELSVEAEDDDDLGLPPTYSATDYGRAEEYEEVERPRRRRLLPMTVAFLALLGFAGVVWYAYDWGSTGKVGGTVPIIQASAGEEKVKPTNEAGMDVPNQESTVLNPQAEAPKEEVLMPPPEEPVVRIEPKPEPEDEAVLILTPAAPPAPPAPSAEGSEQPAGSDTIAYIIAAQTAKDAAAAAATPPAAPAPAGPAPAVAAAPAAPQPLTVTPAVPADAGASETAEPPAVTPAAAPAVPLPAPSAASQPVIAAGAFLIQLASLTSVDAAEQTWARLQKQHAALLGDMAVNIQKAEIDGKGTYFRVQAGPLPNRATADDMCAQLKAAQQDCIVVKK